MQKTSDVYEKLYHYTNRDGLYGILESQCLRATHCRFLNDYSEIVLFKPKLIEFLLPCVVQKIKELMEKTPDIELTVNEKGGLKAVAEHEIANIVNAMYKATGAELYIASFCGEHQDKHANENGLLSQWRGYGKDGGFALVFSTHKLEESLQLEADRFGYNDLTLSDVVYSDDEEKYKAELSPQIDNIAMYVREIIHNMATGKYEPPDSGNAYPAFVECIARYKHCGFKEENEVRIIAYEPNVSAQDKKDKERKFRERNGERVPYIELLDSKDIDLPIERIIVGPHIEKEGRAAALRVMLRNTGIDITVSDIPYIGFG